MMVTPLISSLKYYINENFMNMAIFEPVLGRNNLESRVLESKYAEIDQLLSQNGQKLQRNFRKAQKLLRKSHHLEK